VTPKLATRLALGAAVATAAVLATAGCSFIAPQATLIHYDPAEGVGGDAGTVAIRNAEAVANPDTGAITIVFTAINTSSDAATVSISAGPSGEDSQKTLSLAAGASAVVGDDTAMLTIDDPTDAPIGGLYPVTFQSGTADSLVLQVPVLTDEGRSFLSQFVPTAVPTETPTPTPTATAQ